MHMAIRLQRTFRATIDALLYHATRHRSSVQEPWREWHTRETFHEEGIFVLMMRYRWRPALAE